MKHEIPQVLQFDLFLKYPELIHGMSTRCGGVSQGIYDSLNMGWGLGDDPELVTKNYQIFANALGFPAESYTFSDQVHQAQIAVIDRSDCGNGFMFPKKDELKGMDGLITNKKGVALTIFSADCVPLIFYDPYQQVIAAAHSGWRGTVADIAGRMVDQLEKTFHCQPRHILVGIGPCISWQNFEVGQDVKKEFEKNGKYDILNKVFDRKINGKYLLDLRSYIALALEEKGILPENMEISKECTYGQPELFFSHRRSGLARGSHIMVIYLK
ncbi:peptidoglycan editing factor PgeF [Clostridiales bacterium COT073_COT-073]|nr:peptidoglycan editing factor PgeF [Clostridiales bacterium COT073_COT-073]